MNWNLYLMYGGNKNQWTILKHNGPLFPLPYEPHKVPIIVNNNKIILPELAEEYATMFAKYLDTDYINNKIFLKNFWSEFKKVLPKDLNINKLEDIDFLHIKNHLLTLKEQKNELTKSQKEINKKIQDDYEEPYKYCIIDGVQQHVGNYKIEPPGIFLGRGNHPKSGLIKKRIYPEDVTINISKDCPVPKPNLSNHNWGNIVNDQNVIWLATWKDEITNKNKYIFTSFDSFFKSKSDEHKFDLARQLKKKINKIREEYNNQLFDTNNKNKQLATALYFIDNLALRVGGHKDTTEAADTVGITSLRIEHVTLLEDNNIKLDFLGKDSIRYCKKIKVDDQVYINLTNFITNKNKKDDLFDLINANMINEYLNNFMNNLTAKVWRTFNASYLFQKELDKIKEEHIKNIDPNEKINYLIAIFHQANASVAILCNHQKNVNYSADNTINKINDMLKNLKIKKKNLKNNKKIKSTTDKIKSIDTKIKLLKLKKETKQKIKNVSLETSKDNYIDPRIIFAFSKKFNISPDVFFKKKIKRFEWASNVDKDFKF